MPTVKSHHHRRGTAAGEKNKKGRLTQKALSFNGGTSVGNAGEMSLPRPRTVPDLPSFRKLAERGSPEVEGPPPKLTKLLLNVTIQGSVGAVHVLMLPEATVEDLIAAALQQCSKEGRRPILPSSDAAGFDLHHSQFSLESLRREEKLMALGSRNFFLCRRRCSAETSEETTSSSTCYSNQVGIAVKKMGLPWLKFMGFLL